MSRLTTGAAILSEWWGEGGQPVPQALAQARADVCLKCQFNSRHTLWDEMERPVAKLIRQLLKLKSGMQMKTEGDSELGTCRICFCALPLKVFAPIKFIDEHTEPGALAELPRWCWQVAEIEQLNK